MRFAWQWAGWVMVFLGQPAAAGVLGDDVALPKFGAKQVSYLSDPGSCPQQRRCRAMVVFNHPQINDKACSLAATATLVNSLIPEELWSYGEEFAQQRELLERVESPLWSAGVDAVTGGGITLSQAPALIVASFAAYGVASVRAVAVTAGRGSAASGVVSGTFAQWERDVAASQASALRAIMINFDAGVISEQIPFGHFGLIASYEPDLDRVLVIDPYQQYFTPYWTSVATVWAAMATKDPDSGINRGYLKVDLTKAVVDKPSRPGLAGRKLSTF